MRRRVVDSALWKENESQYGGVSFATSHAARWTPRKRRKFTWDGRCGMRRIGQDLACSAIGMAKGRERVSDWLCMRRNEERWLAHVVNRVGRKVIVPPEREVSRTGA
jgi:hypothetical protein